MNEEQNELLIAVQLLVYGVVCILLGAGCMYGYLHTGGLAP